MNNDPDSAQQGAEYQPPGLMDALRYLYRLRRKLMVRAAIVFVLGTAVFSYYFFTLPRLVEGIVSLGFRGIERGQYPSGRRFSTDDFRTPAVLGRSLADAGIAAARVSPRDLAAHVYVTPVIPGDIQSRWKSEEGRTGATYFPNEFRISIMVDRLTDQEQMKVFDGLISGYLEGLKSDQESGKGPYHLADLDYDKLVAKYDYWDLPDLFRESSRSLGEEVKRTIAESMQYRDATYQLLFRGVAEKLETWERIRLQELQAITYQGRLVRNSDLVEQRSQYRIQNLAIQITHASEQAKEAVRLLQVLDQPKTLASGQLSSMQGLSPVDIAAVDKLIKSDYMKPVVERVSRLQERIQAAETEKEMLEKQLSWLPKPSGPGPRSVPSGYREFIVASAGELNAIRGEYDRLLKEYTSAMMTSLVTIKHSPAVFRTVYPPVLVIPAIAFFSIFVGILMMGIEHVLQNRREQTPR